jgi:hypothetical protein
MATRASLFCFPRRGSNSGRAAHRAVESRAPPRLGGLEQHEEPLSLRKGVRPLWAVLRGASGPVSGRDPRGLVRRGRGCERRAYWQDATACRTRAGRSWKREARHLTAAVRVAVRADSLSSKSASQQSIRATNCVRSACPTTVTQRVRRRAGGRMHRTEGTELGEDRRKVVHGAHRLLRHLPWPAARRHWGPQQLKARVENGSKSRWTHQRL